jgi:hypothetical protein
VTTRTDPSFKKPQNSYIIEDSWQGEWVHYEACPHVTRGPRLLPVSEDAKHRLRAHCVLAFEEPGRFSDFAVFLGASHSQSCIGELGSLPFGCPVTESD